MGRIPVSLHLYLLLLSSLVASGEISIKPNRILSDRDPLILDSGTSIVLECEADEPIHWRLPEHRQHEQEIVEALAPSAGYKYKSRLTLTSASHTDTGLYCCNRYDVPDTYDSNCSSSIGVYVQDATHLIAAHFLIYVRVHQGDPAVIPCIPTHPDIEISLERISGERVTEPWSYHPLVGFVLQEASLYTAGSYSCKAARGEQYEEVFVTVQYRPDVPVPSPHINSSQASGVITGQTFTLDCSITNPIGSLHLLEWKIPSPTGFSSGRIITQLKKGENLNQSYEIYHQILTVNNASSEDQGNYRCVCSNMRKESTEASTNVTIFDENTSHLDLEIVPQRLENYTGAVIKWVLQIEAYPKPTVTWYKEKTVISSSVDPRYGFEIKGKSQTMIIKSLQFDDAGEYRIEANNSRRDRKVVNLTLVVNGPPEIEKQEKEIDEQHLVLQKDPFRVRCKILAYPKPTESNITLLYRDCVPSSCDGEFVPLLLGKKNVSALVNSEKMVLLHEPSKWVTVVNITGVAVRGRQYMCSACNTLGCSKVMDESIIRLQVTDLPKKLEMQLSEVIPGDKEPLTLNCSINLYVFPPNLTWTWTDKTGKVQTFTKSVSSISPELPFKVNSITKNYSYTEELVWDSVTSASAGNYTCQSIPFNGETPEEDSLPITIHSPMSPVIENPSPETRSMDEASKELVCEGYGVPIPEKTWYKNEELFTEQVHKSINRTSITFTYMTAKQAGKYKCVFSNKYGKVEKEFTLTISNPNKPIEIAVGVVVVIVVILIAVLVFKIYKEKKRKAYFRVKALKRFEAGDPDSINPELGVDEQAELLPYDNRWEFPRERLKLGKQLGSGAFGRVLKAEAIGICPSESEAGTIVAVKMVKHHANTVALKALMSELKIMIHLGSHLNVVNLLGACTKNIAKGELLVIVEYCRYGNMQNFLCRHRDAYIDQVDHSRGVVDPNIGADILDKAARASNGGYEVPLSPARTSDYRSPSVPVNTDMSFVSMSPTAGGTIPSDVGEIDSSGQLTVTGGSHESRPPWRSNYRGDYQNKSVEPICTKDLICWAFQIARGMDYLTSRKVMHGDLAARNILLADEKIVKIADFGLAREVYRSGNYKKKSDGPLPVKWMAPESITDRNFSSQSDVWAFGIVLWELFSLGKTPYPGMDADEQFLKKLLNGYRMDCPKYAPSDMYAIMQHCWETEPKHRPTFCQLEEQLGNQLEASVRHHYIDLNAPYLSKNSEQAKQATDYLNMMSQPQYVNVNTDQGHDYVNCPVQSPGASAPKQSDYLSMNPLDGESLVQIDGSGYLYMTSPTPKDSAPATGKSNHKFDFDFAPKVRKINEADADLVELSPMLTAPSPSEENSKSLVTDDRKDSGFYSPDARSFSNPNYIDKPNFFFQDDSKPTTPSDEQANQQPSYQNLPIINKDRHYVNQPT